MDLYTPYVSNFRSPGRSPAFSSFASHASGALRLVDVSEKLPQLIRKPGINTWKVRGGNRARPSLQRLEPLALPFRAFSLLSSLCWTSLNSLSLVLVSTLACGVIYCVTESRDTRQRSFQRSASSTQGEGQGPIFGGSSFPSPLSHLLSHCNLSLCS